MVRNCCTVDSVTTYYVTSTRRFPPRLGLFLLQLLDRNRQHSPIHFTIEEQEEEEEEEKEGEEGKKKRSSHFDLWILDHDYRFVRISRTTNSRDDESCDRDERGSAKGQGRKLKRSS